MSFYSLKFLAFLSVALAAYWFAPARRRPALLLAFSYGFCLLVGGARAVQTLFAVGLLSYSFARAIDASSGRTRSAALFLGTLVLIVILGCFKYGGAFRGWLLPLGLSYYVFAALSYLIDVYLEKRPFEKDLPALLLHLAFFPKLIQGPIERAGDLLPQLKAENRFDSARAAEGGRLILAGLFKKFVIADRLSLLVAAVFDHVADHRGLVLLIAVYAFTWQIYCDFAGYTDIARGVAKLFGIELRPNFDRPFSSTSIQEFWRRWHISFSSWLRDYLFMPLIAALRDYGTAGIVAASMTTFAIAGVWHGLSWGFLVFGLLHGVYMAGSVLTLKARDRFLRRRGWDGAALQWTRRLITFHMVAVSFAVFRCRSLSDALYLFTHLGGGAVQSAFGDVLSPIELAGLAAILLAGLYRMPFESFRRRNPALVDAALVNAVIFLGVKSDAPFIYFKF